MIRSFLNVFLPEDEYKRLRILYFMAEAAFLMVGLLLLGATLNKMALKWNFGEGEVTFVLFIIPMFVVIYTFFRYIFSGMEYTEVSTKQGYKKELHSAFIKSVIFGLLFFIITFIITGVPTDKFEIIDLTGIATFSAFFYFLFSFISLKRSLKKNKELEE